MPLSNTKLNVLFFCNKPKQESDANTIVEHINAFKKYSKHRINCITRTLYYPDGLNINWFDVVIIHYSSYLLNDSYLSADVKAQIHNFTGLKVLFLQDEYRRVNQFHDMINYLKIDILYTCIPEPEIEKIYPKEKLPNLIKINNLTGYISKKILTYKPPAIAQRKIDVGYRSRKLPYWYGQLAVEKWKIVDDFIYHSSKDNLTLDLSYQEEKRMYGEKWINFILSCKTMLDVESGASVIDFTGDIEASVDTYQREYPLAPFEEVQSKFLMPYENKIIMRQISPRCFEAIALKTPLVLFEGMYSGILIPHKHYIPLKKDFSNINDVIKKIKDLDYLQKLADTAYKEIALNSQYSYKYFIKTLDGTINRVFKEKRLVAKRYFCLSVFFLLLILKQDIRDQLCCFWAEKKPEIKSKIDKLKLFTHFCFQLTRRIVRRIARQIIRGN